MNVLSSEGRNKACFGYAESRKTTNFTERFLSPNQLLIGISYKFNNPEYPMPSDIEGSLL